MKPKSTELTKLSDVMVQLEREMNRCRPESLELRRTHKRAVRSLIFLKYTEVLLVLHRILEEKERVRELLNQRLELTEVNASDPVTGHNVFEVFDHQRLL